MIKIKIFFVISYVLGLKWVLFLILCFIINLLKKVIIKSGIINRCFISNVCLYEVIYELIQFGFVLKFRKRLERRIMIIIIIVNG